MDKNEPVVFEIENNVKVINNNYSNKIENSKFPKIQARTQSRGKTSLADHHAELHGEIFCQRQQSNISTVLFKERTREQVLSSRLLPIHE